MNIETYSIIFIIFLSLVVIWSINNTLGLQIASSAIILVQFSLIYYYANKLIQEP